MIDTHADDRQKLHGARERQRGSTENALDTARLGKARLRACLAAAFSLTRHARQEAQTNTPARKHRQTRTAMCPHSPGTFLWVLRDPSDTGPQLEELQSPLQDKLSFLHTHKVRIYSVRRTVPRDDEPQCLHLPGFASLFSGRTATVGYPGILQSYHILEKYSRPF